MLKKLYIKKIYFKFWYGSEKVFYRRKKIAGAWGSTAICGIYWGVLYLRSLLLMEHCCAVFSLCHFLLNEVLL